MHANAELMDLESRMDRLEENYMRVMQQWAESIESKDRYTAGHCERVANYACMLAAEVGFNGRDLTWFRMGAYLHDVGKTEVPAEVLNKPGRLTEADWELMKRHAVAGDEIVAELNFPWDIRPIVRNHHERWDGTGYPDSLAGEAIPLTARILCVADVFDALTTARSYRPALPREEALRIMRHDSGKLLDPSLFETFCHLLDQQTPAISQHN
jgi:putative nucleotidyltransferase with HDIG domain